MFLKEGEILKLKDKKVGFVLTGSFCTFKSTIEQMENIIKAQKQNIDKNACSKICEFIIDEIRKYSK